VAQPKAVENTERLTPELRSFVWPGECVAKETSERFRNAEKNYGRLL
jgi:hypothetical protein